MKLNETTHCMFCNCRLGIDLRCHNKDCKYEYGSRNLNFEYRSFILNGVWYHYEPNGMRIYSNGKAIDVDRHLTLDQIKNFELFI